MKKNRTKKKGLRFLILLVVALCVASVAGLWFLGQKNIAISFQPESYQLSNEQLNNPYCGWYHTYEYQITGETPFDVKSVETAAQSDNNTRLCGIIMDLGAYPTGGLPDEAICQIEEILTAWSATDKQMLLAFYYSVTPEQMETIYLHTEQLAAIVNEHYGHIYSLQCWGTITSEQMKASDFFKGENLSELIRYQASLIDNRIFLAVESIQHYQTLTGFLALPSEDVAYTEVLPARLGICHRGVSGESSQAEKQALGQLGHYVPMGGVPAFENGTEQTDTAMEVLPEYGISYLCGDDNGCVTAWKNEPYRGDDVFSGVTVYDYMTTHLGYRYVIKGAETSFDNWKDEDATIKLTLQNIGFSNAYRLFDTSILLKNTETEEIITLPLDEDNRRWLSGEEVSIETKLDIKNYEKGKYYIYFMMLDTRSGEVIRMGNTLPLTNNGYQLGVLEIQ